MNTAMKEWKVNKDKGVAMVVCITIISILVIFCFSLLLVSYTLYASQNKNNQSDQNQEAAKSFADAIKKELTESDESSNLMRYLRYNVGQDSSWPYYAPDEAGHGEVDAKRYFYIKKNEAAKIAGFPSRIEVCMYWMPPEPDPEADPGAERELKNHLKLFIEVTAKSGSQSYSILSTYELSLRTGESIYPEQSPKINFNPANNTISRDELWVWKFLGSE